MTTTALRRTGTVLLMAALAEGVCLLLVDLDLLWRFGRVTTAARMVGGVLLVIKGHRAVGRFVAHRLRRGRGRGLCWRITGKQLLNIPQYLRRSFSFSVKILKS